VAWYPIATEAADLSEEDSLFQALGRWKAREVGAKVHIRFNTTNNAPDASYPILFPGFECAAEYDQMGTSPGAAIDCGPEPLGLPPLSFVIADYQLLEKPSVLVRYLHGQDTSAAAYADEAEKLAPFIAEWFGKLREKARTAELPDPKATPFESGFWFLTPFTSSDQKLMGLAVAHQLTHAAFLSFRPWIEEGLAHFAQALYQEHEKGRQAALEYMGLHRSAFLRLEKSPAMPKSEQEVGHALVNTANEELYRSKAMCVWWMLRDMVGDAALKKALTAYRADRDKEPSYMPRLIAAETQRDLEWFFDDWVYRDRGLPDFKVESAFARKTMTNSFLITITVDNLGTAGAEVPLIVKFAGGDTTKRLAVRAQTKATIRVEVPAAPQEIVVNDGSVPESNTTNHRLKIETVSP
jgi:hypothetical protein